MTGPYRPEVADLVRGAHEQRVTMTLDGGVVAALTGSLMLSEDWSPYGQLQATLANSYSPAELEALDPREDLDVVLMAGYVHPDGTVGGEYTSRGTLNFFPHGFEIAGAWMPEQTSTLAHSCPVSPPEG